MPEDPGSFETELAKAVGEVAVESARDVRKVFSHVFGQGATQLAHIISDQLEYFKFRNQARIIVKANKLINELGIDKDSLKKLSFSEQARVLESASVEDEEDIQDLWARLTVNAMIDNFGVQITKSYCDLLKSISPIEAKFLNLLYEGETHIGVKSRIEIEAFHNFMNKIANEGWRKIDSPAQDTALQNLIRLRRISFRPYSLSHRTIFARLPSTMTQNEKWQLVDAEGLTSILNQLYELLAVTAGARRYDRRAPILITNFGHPTGGKIEIPEMNYMLTSLGAELMRSCRIPKAGTPIDQK